MSTASPTGTTGVPAVSLLSPRRFDVVAKYVYAKWRLRGIDSDWARALYLAHIDVFNGFVEPDGSGKAGQTRFLEDFDSLIDAVAARGFDSGISKIPRATNGELLNGAHRLAACLAAGCDASVETDATQTAYSYDHRWFQRRGLDLCWADAIAVEACKLLPDSFVIVVYPSAVGRDDELETLIDGRARIWYRKHVMLSDNGAVNLVQQIYRHERWVGGPHNDFKGAHEKKSWCFKQAGPVRLWLVQSDIQSIRTMKSDIRAIFNIGNHSVHINDLHEEARELAGLLFNENSVTFLNQRTRAALPWFDTLLSAYGKSLKDSEADTDDYCVAGSGVLAAHGMRDVRDVDFLHDSRCVMPEFGVPQISSHNGEARWYASTPEHIIHDPRCHFIFNALKFATVDVVHEMKKRRGEMKDREDLALIANWTALSRDWAAPLRLPDFRAAFSWRRLYQRARFLKLRWRLLMHSLRKHIKSQ